MIFIIGNPENRRVTGFQQALHSLGHPPAGVISYLDLLENVERATSQISAGDRVRIESPGENELVTQRLIERGARLNSELVDAQSMHGEINYAGLNHAGYVNLLAEVDERLSQRVRWMNAPREIAVLFDKTGCQQRLATAGIPTPPFLGTVRSFAEFEDLLQRTERSRVFVKLQHSSSASGVLAVSRQRDRWRVTTSVELHRCAEATRLFNSLRVRTYDDPTEIAAIVDGLGAQDGLHVERWVPKIGFAGKTFDLRIVTIAGEPQHIVMRTSDGPITNLHLGNARGDVPSLIASLSPEAWASAWDSCRRCAQLFPECLYLGIDLAFLSRGRHIILEVNAFGDLLPGVTMHGLSTYEAEIQAFS